MNARHAHEAGWIWPAAVVALTVLTWIGGAPAAAALEWRAFAVVDEPWRAWTGAFVHLSLQHLAANLFGLAVVTVYAAAAGVARLTWRTMIAAWPLTHLLLLAQPALQHYGGLSGVLHAAVAIVAVLLLTDAAGTRGVRLVGLFSWLGLLAKVLAERPWDGPVRDLGWDFPVAPIAHAGGLVAGTSCALVVVGWRSWRHAARRKDDPLCPPAGR